MKKKTVAVILAITAASAILLLPAAYFGAKFAFERHFSMWGKRLVDLEKQGLLSKEFGAAWKDVLDYEAMKHQARAMTLPDAAPGSDSVAIVNGVRLNDYPSLSIVARLNEINRYSNTIEITDRRDRRLAVIRTDHTRGKLDEFPQALLTCIVAAEDETFWTNSRGFEFRSYVRAALRAAFRALTTFRISAPQGTSTITQQVAKLFISRLDESGRRFASRSVDRKLREMKLAAAIRAMYSPEEVLEVYLNHCITSDYGLIGCKDIALGLFGKKPRELSDAECVYIARMVKWGRNFQGKITRQCRIDMPRMAAACGWDLARQAAIIAAVDSLRFQAPRQIQTDFGQLVDCANEFWLQVLEKNGMPENRRAEMNIIDPNSLVRKKGNLKIRLTIDLGLQRELERLVNARGYGRDTVILTDVRIGSAAGEVSAGRQPADTVRRVTVMTDSAAFTEPGSAFRTVLKAGDTLVTNVRYRKTGRQSWRRSVFYYTRMRTKVQGQYFSYAIMDSRTGRLLAYYSRDRIGSRLAGLMKLRTPNGSSTAKPIFNALNFDLGLFQPYSSWDDSAATPDTVAWRREFYMHNGRTVGVTFAKSAVKGQGYQVSNHSFIFEGCQYVFDLLATSNNILGAETVYRLDTELFDRQGNVQPQGFGLAQFFTRIGAFGRVKNDLGLRTVTGVRVYKELARITGVDTDSMEAYGRRIQISDSLYSVALGTLELTLYEQMHLFNMLYDNNMIEQPARHPSLAIDSIIIDGAAVAINDTIRRFHPFGDVNNLRPTWLGLHKRLTGNPYDGLAAYDIPCSGNEPAAGGPFDPEAYMVDAPLSNFAKSGTSDDVIRPFNVDATSAKRTNYGLWNAVIRIDLSKLSAGDEPDVRDVTIACIGECSQKHTGERDGKTLHKFLSKELLQKAGQKSPNGFFGRYEAYIRATTPERERNCGRQTAQDETPEPLESLERGD